MPKRKKDAVDYGRGMRSAHCAICKHFVAPNQCERVSGTISPKAWCRLFSKGTTDDERRG